MYKIYNVFIVFFSILFFASCSSEDSKNDLKTNVEVQQKNVFNSEDFDFVLPQPISLAKAFQASGLSYFPNLTNPFTNKENYNEKVKQLINLGVYSTDLAYCAINDHPQDARGYLKAIQELGIEVGLKPVFSDKKIIENFDKSLNNMEAVESLIYDIQERSEEYMQDNDVRYLSIVQFSGAWTEGMYLGVKDIELSPDKKNNLSLTIVDQMNLLKNIIQGIKTYPTTDKILNAVNDKLKSVLDLYNNFESVKKSNESDSFQSPVLTKEEFRSLSSKIVDLRNFMIK